MQRPSERAIFQLFDQVQSHGTQQFTFPRIVWCLLVKVRINCNHEKLLQMRFYMHPQWTCCSLLLRRYRRCHSPCTFDRLSFTPRSSSALTAGKVAGTYSPLAAPFPVDISDNAPGDAHAAILIYIVSASLFTAVTG